MQGYDRSVTKTAAVSGDLDKIHVTSAVTASQFQNWMWLNVGRALHSRAAPARIMMG
jgi:hypothetical protein